jgi:hypothetical protein
MLELKDILTLSASAVALVVSLSSLRRSWQFNLASLRNTARHNYMNALLDVNRQLVDYPQLWSTYDGFAAANDLPLEINRRRGFIWYHLNLFETVYAEFKLHRLEPLDHEETDFWTSWDRYIRSFLDKSPEARAIVENDESMKLLNAKFTGYLRECLRPQNHEDQSRP